eukprot:TRINITY_DN769_c0_g1_i1.p2 TRINITY_DN769_c0_g1~~TRINITY_DN769_c0_g1_i1.p2  ORF type:complete len:359 (-),score=67.50 TRINITY_DN769_c0_g1_i1:1815-2891(-)
MASSSSARAVSPTRSSPTHSSPPSPPNPSPISRVMRRATAASRRQIRRARRRPVRPEPSALRALLIRFPEHDASTVSALLSRHAGDAAAVTELLERARQAPPSSSRDEQPPAVNPLPPPPPPPPRPQHTALRVSGVKRSRQHVRPDQSPTLPPLSPAPSRTPPALTQHRAITPPSPLLTPSVPHPRRSHSFDPSPVFTPSLPPSAASISLSADPPSATPAQASALIQQLSGLENRLHVFLATSRQQHVAIRRALHQAHVDLQSLRATHNVLRVEVEETTSRVSRADDFLDRLRRDVQTALVAKRNTAVNRVRGVALHVFYTVLSVTVRLVFFIGTLGKRAWIAVRRDAHDAPKPSTQT